jgi:hypothetical protein
VSKPRHRGGDGQNSGQINRVGIPSIEQCSVPLNRVVGKIMILPNRCPNWPIQRQDEAD